MLFHLDFADNIILLSFFLFFVIIDVDLLIPAAIAQMLNPIAELLIPIRIPGKEEKANSEIHQVIAKAKIRKCSI